MAVAERASRLALVALAALLLAGPGVARAAATDPIAHDPTLIKQGAYYYDVITGDIETRTYLPMRRSRDLVHWEFLGPVFTTPPAWVVDALGTTPGDFWAPDIRYFGGRYHLYYAASQFATNNSVIGLATNRTLDPHSPRYRWVDEGMVMRSTPGVDDFNAIDPDVVFDGRGRPWMAFGSFWSGVKLRRLDRSTGKPADSVVHPLATRPAPGAVEGPSIVRHGGFYYLFVSFDFCCRGIDSDYRLMVGRARRVTGPYVDRDGVPLLDGGGTELLRGYNEFAGPGGADVYGRWLVHHYYDRDDAGVPKLSVRRLHWRRGWPALGDPLSGSREAGHGPAYYEIASRASGALMEDAGCGYEGANIQLGPDRDSPCRRWRPEYRGDGWSSLLNQFSNKVAEAAGCATQNGANVAQWGWLANDCQRFRFLPASDGFLRIENRRSGRVLDVAGCGGAGANVQLWDWLGTECQQFRLQPAGGVTLLDAATGRQLAAGPCRWRHCLWDFTHTRGAYEAVTERRSGYRLGEWRLQPGNDDTVTLVPRAGAERRVKIVVP